MFLLIDPQIRGRKFQQREIDLDQFTNEDRTRGHCCCDCPGPIPGPIVMRGVRFLAAEVQTLAQATMEDKNPWNGYGKPSFHILNLSNRPVAGGGAGGARAPPEIFRLELNSATKVVFFY